MKMTTGKTKPVFKTFSGHDGERVILGSVSRSGFWLSFETFKTIPVADVVPGQLQYGDRLNPDGSVTTWMADSTVRVGRKGSYSIVALVDRVRYLPGGVTASYRPKWWLKDKYDVEKVWQDCRTDYLRIYGVDPWKPAGAK